MKQEVKLHNENEVYICRYNFVVFTFFFMSCGKW